MKTISPLIKPHDECEFSITQADHMRVTRGMMHICYSLWKRRQAGMRVRLGCHSYH